MQIKPEGLVRREGVELEQLAAMLATFDATVEVYHADRLGSVGAFREVASAALANPRKRIIVNYLRAATGQQGGHHSP